MARVPDSSPTPATPHSYPPQPAAASFPGLTRAGDLIKPLPSAILERRTTLHFTSDPVPAPFVDAILRLGIEAPSAYNLQPWRFLVVRAPETKARIQPMLHDPISIVEAPLLIVGVGLREEFERDAQEIMKEAGARGLIAVDDLDEMTRLALDYVTTVPNDVWVTRQVMCALTTMMLVAETYGFDTALIEAVDRRALAAELKIPADAEIVGLLAVGHAQGDDRPYPGRLPASHVVFNERYGNPYSGAVNVDEER